MKIETLKLKTAEKWARVWLNNKSSKACGFIAGVSYSASYSTERVVIKITKNGKRTVAKGDIVDLQNKTLKEQFEGVERVHAHYSKNEIIITAYHHDDKVKERVLSVKERVSRKIPLRVSEFCAGIGYLGKQIAKGLFAAGIATQLVFANDFDQHATDILANYTYASEYVNSSGPIIVHDDLFTMNKDLIPKSDVMIIGYCCQGLSQQQSSVRNKDLKHKVSGVLFVPLLEAISRSNPAFIVLENSDKMLGSDTDDIMTQVLTRTGYDYTYQILSGQNFGDFEKRNRLAKVFYSKGLNPLDLKELVSNVPNKRVVSDLLEPIDDNAKEWKEFNYLKVKNSEKSHSHAFISVDGASTKLPTFLASYGKMQADSAFLPHPSNPKLHRIFRAAEHCNVRNITGKLKEGIVSIADGTHHLQAGRTNARKAQSLLGNSVSPTPWYDLGEFLGGWLTTQAPISNITNNTQQELFS